jgi:DNA-binding transcriptional MerR regulator
VGRVLLTSGGAARILGITPTGVQFLERTGKLAAERTASGMRLFDLVEVEALAETRRKAIEGRRLHPLVGPYDHAAR